MFTGIRAPRMLTLAKYLLLSFFFFFVWIFAFGSMAKAGPFESTWFDETSRGLASGSLAQFEPDSPLGALAAARATKTPTSAGNIPTPTPTKTNTPSGSPSKTPTPTSTVKTRQTSTPTSMAPTGYVWPVPTWETSSPASLGMDAGLLNQARDFALTGGGSGFITRHGRLALSWGSSTQRYDLKSTTKSFGATILALALLDGRLGPGDLAQSCHPSLGIPPDSNAATGWLDDISLLHLATHTAGFDKNGGYTALLFAPGTKWSYSDGGPNWLAECLTLEYQQDLNTLLFNRVLTPLGIGPADLTWRSNLYRSDTINGIKNREFGAGISADVDAMARLGYLYLRDGVWNGQRLLPSGFPAQAGSSVAGVVGLPVNRADLYPQASDHYGLLWWNNADGTLANVPADAYFAWGLGDSLIVVIPSLDIVASRAGSAWGSGSGLNYERLRPFIEPIALSVID